MDKFTLTLLVIGGLLLILAVVAFWPDKKEKKSPKNDGGGGIITPLPDKPNENQTTQLCLKNSEKKLRLGGITPLNLG